MTLSQHFAWLTTVSRWFSYRESFIACRVGARPSVFIKSASRIYNCSVSWRFISLYADGTIKVLAFTYINAAPFSKWGRHCLAEWRIRASLSKTKSERWLSRDAFQCHAGRKAATAMASILNEEAKYRPSVKSEYTRILWRAALWRTRKRKMIGRKIIPSGTYPQEISIGWEAFRPMRAMRHRGGVRRHSRRLYSYLAPITIRLKGDGA